MSIFQIKDNIRIITSIVSDETCKAIFEIRSPFMKKKMQLFLNPLKLKRFIHPPSIVSRYVSIAEFTKHIFCFLLNEYYLTDFSTFKKIGPFLIRNHFVRLKCCQRSWIKIFKKHFAYLQDILSIDITDKLIHNYDTRKYENITIEKIFSVMVGKKPIDKIRMKSTV